MPGSRSFSERSLARARSNEGRQTKRAVTLNLNSRPQLRLFPHWALIRFAQSLRAKLSKHISRGLFPCACEHRVDGTPEREDTSPARHVETGTVKLSLE